MLAAAILFGWCLPVLLLLLTRARSHAALRGAVLTYMTVQLEADSHELHEIFGPAVYDALAGLVGDGFLERVEGLPVERRGWRPEVRYFWLSRSQRAERAAIPRARA